jgi:DNA-binding CsgD family transcriptional regulator
MEAHREPVNRGRSEAHRRVQGRARRLALAKLRELRALGWSYRDIGRYFAHERSTEPTAADGSVRVVLPAHLRATAPQGAAADHRAFLHALDMVSEGLAFFDTEGMLLHTNRALVRALQHGGAGEELQREILALARSLGARVRRGRESSGEMIGSGELESREVRTAAGTYRLRGSHLAVDPFGLDGSVLIALELPLSPLLSDEALRERFGLTPQERRIGRLIAAGRSNAEIAAELGISPHTARRHTERLFAKLAVRSRAEVGQRLHSSGREQAKDR